MILSLEIFCLIFFYAVCQLIIFFGSWESLSTMFFYFSNQKNGKKKMKNSHGICRPQNLLTHYYYYYYLFIIIILFFFFIYLFVFSINLLFYVF